jgi:uncharacterized protein (TIGR00251 family)
VIDVHVSPGSSRPGVHGTHGTALKVAVRAPPEKGKANKELEALLARFFGVGKRDVSVISGLTSRSKRLQFKGLTEEACGAKLRGL